MANKITMDDFYNLIDKHTGFGTQPAVDTRETLNRLLAVAGGVPQPEPMNMPPPELPMPNLNNVGTKATANIIPIKKLRI